MVQGGNVFNFWIYGLGEMNVGPLIQIRVVANDKCALKGFYKNLDRGCKIFCIHMDVYEVYVTLMDGCSLEKLTVK